MGGEEVGGGSHSARGSYGRAYGRVLWTGLLSGVPLARAMPPSDGAGMCSGTGSGLFFLRSAVVGVHFSRAVGAPFLGALRHGGGLACCRLGGSFRSFHGEYSRVWGVLEVLSAVRPDFVGGGCVALGFERGMSCRVPWVEAP